MVGLGNRQNKPKASDKAPHKPVRKDSAVINKPNKVATPAGGGQPNLGSGASSGVFKLDTVSLNEIQGEGLRGEGSNQVETQVLSGDITKTKKEGKEEGNNETVTGDGFKPEFKGLKWLDDGEVAAQGEKLKTRLIEVTARINKGVSTGLNRIGNWIAGFFKAEIKKENKSEADGLMGDILYIIFDEGIPKLMALPLMVIAWFTFFEKKEVKDDFYPITITDAHTLGLLIADKGEAEVNKLIKEGKVIVNVPD